MNKSPFLQHIIETMREKRYAKRTIEAYIYWIRFYINFHNKQHPAQLNDSDVEVFLNFLVNKRKVAAQTQAGALNALSFLYKVIIQKPLTLKRNIIKTYMDALHIRRQCAKIAFSNQTIYIRSIQDKA